MLCYLICPIKCGSPETVSPPSSLTSDHWEKLPEKVCHQSLGAEGKGSAACPSVPDSSGDTDLVINEILHSININIASDSSEHSSGGNYCQNNGLLGQSSLPPAPMAGAGTESVFYCAEGCFVLDQGRIFAEKKTKKGEFVVCIRT